MVSMEQALCSSISAPVPHCRPPFFPSRPIRVARAKKPQRLPASHLINRLRLIFASLAFVPIIFAAARSPLCTTRVTVSASPRLSPPTPKAPSARSPAGTSSSNSRATALILSTTRASRWCAPTPPQCCSALHHRGGRRGRRTPRALRRGSRGRTAYSLLRRPRAAQGIPSARLARARLGRGLRTLARYRHPALCRETSATEGRAWRAAPGTGRRLRALG